MSRLLPGVFASSGSEYLLDGSTRFDNQIRTHLKRQQLFNANRRKFTFATWIKHDQTGTSTDYSFIVSSKRKNSTWFIDPDYQLTIIDYDLPTATYPVNLRTDMKLRDHTGWYHIMVSVDTTLATESDRVKMYVNGERITSFSQAVYPPRYHSWNMLTDDPFAIGGYLWGNIYDYSGYMSDFYYADGIVLGPNDFLEDGPYNQKIPKQYTGDLGKNGIYLPLRTKHKFKELGMNFDDRNVGGDPYFDNTAMLIQATENVGGNNLTITDSSPNNFSITYSGAPGQGGESPFRRNRDVLYDPSLDGQSIHFNGTSGSDCVYVPASSNANIGTGDFTVEFWMKSKVYATDTVFKRIWMLDGPTQNTSSQNLQILQDNSNGELYIWNGAQRLGTSGGQITDNGWHHVALSRQSGTLRAFIDGVQLFSVSNTTDFTANGGSPRMRIGGYDSSTGRYDGLLSNMRVVIGTAVYTANFDVPTEPLTAISGTQLLFKESPINVFDAAAKAVVGTIGSTVVANDQTAYRPTSIRIPSNSYLRMPSDFLNDIGTGDFCVEMWMRGTSPLTSKFIFGSSNGGGGQPKFGIYTNASGQIQVDINGSVVLTTSQSIAANNWYHIAIVRERGTLHVYRSGRRIGSVANSSNITGLTRPFHIGWFGEGSINFDGWIDQFRVTIGNARYYSGFMVPSYQHPQTGPKAFYPYGWDWSGYYGDDPEFPNSFYGRYPVAKVKEFTSENLGEIIPNPDPIARGLVLALSGSYVEGDDTITDLMPEGRIYNAATITRNGISSTTTYNGGGSYGSFEYDGTAANYIAADLAYDISTDDFTIECDIRCTNWYSGSGLFRRIWWIGDALGNSLSLNVDASGFLAVRWNDSIIITSSVAINQTASLYHVALVREYYGNMTLYINEINRGSTTFQTNISAATTAGPVYIGNNSLLNAPWHGMIANFRIYRIAKFNNLSSLNAAQFENVNNGPARRFYPYSFESPTPHQDSEGYVYGNFMKMNAGNMIASTISGGGLEYSGSGNTSGIWSTMAIPSTGQWLFDIYDLTGDLAVMLDQNPSIVSTHQAGGTTTSLQAYIYGSTTSIVHNGGTTSFTNWSNTDAQRISLFLDMDANKITIRRNNLESTEIVYTFNSSLKSNPLYFGYKVNTTWPATTRHYYFGESRSYTFSYFHNKGYTLSTDNKVYKPICDYNISQALTINDPSKYFDVALWSGDGINGRQVSDIDFSADLVWAKSRGSATFTDHVIGDRNRGTNKTIFPNATAAEQSNNEIGFISGNGFSVGNSSRVNQSGIAYAGWAWKVGNSLIENTDGSIKSDILVNSDTKMSIVRYTSPNVTSDQTVGHGLGSPPKLIIVKNLDASYNWDIYHHKLGTNASLTFTSGTTRSGAFGSTINNSIFTTKNAYTHAGFDRYIAYCFDEVPGFSRFGTFIGNGQNDGTFVYTGFKPAFVIIKCSSSTGGWNLMDYRRIGRNPKNYVLYPDTNVTEQGYQPIDILSNGFKLRSTNTGTNAFNASGQTHIYIAFAEAPEFGALAR